MFQWPCSALTALVFLSQWRSLCDYVNEGEQEKGVLRMRRRESIEDREINRNRARSRR